MTRKSTLEDLVQPFDTGMTAIGINFRVIGTLHEGFVQNALLEVKRLCSRRKQGGASLV